jgi:hypothetical protein
MGFSLSTLAYRAAHNSSRRHRACSTTVNCCDDFDVLRKTLRPGRRAEPYERYSEASGNNPVAETTRLPKPSSEGAGRTNGYPPSDLSQWRALGFDKSENYLT